MSRAPELPSFEELAALEPELAELEAQARSYHDDGTAPFFCSNFLWLPMYTRLRSLIGAHRPPDEDGSTEGALYDSRVFELAYEHLSRLMPPCRDCGCHRFDPVRREQLGEV